MQYHLGHGDRCRAGREQSQALLLEHLVMLAEDASQLVIENLAIIRAILHSPSMGALIRTPSRARTGCAATGAGQRGPGTATHPARPAAPEHRNCPGQLANGGCIARAGTGSALGFP